MLTKRQMQTVCSPLTGKLHLQKCSMLVCEGIPIIEVKFAATSISDKDTEGEAPAESGSCFAMGRIDPARAKTGS
jgi:hypothetical protein